MALLTAKKRDCWKILIVQSFVTQPRQRASGHNGKGKIKELLPSNRTYHHLELLTKQPGFERELPRFQHSHLPCHCNNTMLPLRGTGSLQVFNVFTHYKCLVAWLGDNSIQERQLFRRRIRLFPLQIQKDFKQIYRDNQKQKTLDTDNKMLGPIQEI